MKAVFERAKVIVDGEDTYLCLSIPRRDAAKFVGEMKPRKYAVEIKEYRKKRSLDANAYAWTLIGKLAAVLSTKEAPVTPDNVYRDCIRDVGDNYDVIPVKEDRIEYWNRIWCAGHIGRFTEDLGPCRSIPGYHNIRTYIGSSDYDTAQMSRLIEIIIQECKAQGVETLPPRELDALVRRCGEVSV
jgi:hypothetical protein